MNFTRLKQEFTAIVWGLEWGVALTIGHRKSNPFPDLFKVPCTIAQFLCTYMKTTSIVRASITEVVLILCCHNHIDS
jgi:hypothetical protein